MTEQNNINNQIYHAPRNRFNFIDKFRRIIKKFPEVSYVHSINICRLKSNIISIVMILELVIYIISVYLTSLILKNILQMELPKSMIIVSANTSYIITKKELINFIINDFFNIFIFKIPIFILFLAIIFLLLWHFSSDD
ncbi:MAG: hypothetical protein M3Z87_20735 [Lactobacillus sp.]|nr:hypothetical protein [Lactobacillus sp.]